MPFDPLDPSQPLPQPVQRTFTNPERALGAAIFCYTLDERDALPMEWRREGATIVYVDRDWGAEGPPTPPEGGWRGDPLPDEAPLPDPDERPEMPFAPGAYFRLQNGRSNDNWVYFGGGGGESRYSNPGTGVTVGGAPAGSVFENATHNEVFDAQFRAVFNAGIQITDLAGAGIEEFGGQFIFEKGTSVTVTAIGAMNVGAGSITSRAVLVNGVLYNSPVANAFAALDPTPRTAVTSYTATMHYLTNLNASGTRTSAARTLTPYALTFFGVVNSLTPSESQLKAFGGHLWGPAGRSMAFGANAALAQRAAFAEPQDLGGVRQIKDTSGFIYYDVAAAEGSNSFSRVAVSYTLPDGRQEPYWLFVKKTPAGNGTPFTYLLLR